MTRPRPPRGRLPDHWPSAWPSLRRRVVEGVATVVLTAALAMLGTVVLGDVRRAWWIALLPVLFLVVPLSRPARTRAAFVRGAARRGLRLRPDDGAGTVVSAGRRRARIGAEGSVRYL